MSDVEVHLVCGKHTRSIKVSIDSRCKVTNFAGNYPELKHTIWWKGLFVSDIYILCDAFVVNAHKKKHSLRPTSICIDFLVKNVANKDCIVSENGEALSQEQIDEIKTMLVSYRNQKVTDVELDLYVLKLLYCYILPSFVFMRTDLEWLQWCLKLVGDQLQKVDGDLIKNDKQLVKFETKLHVKRKAFCNMPEEQKENLLMTSNKKFLNNIISDLRKDCQSLEIVYNKSRIQVQNLKERSRNESTMQCGEEDESEVERDLYFEREESHRIYREMIALKINIANIEHIKLKEGAWHMKNDRRDSLSLPLVYVEFHELRETLKKMIDDLCLEKLRLKSIAEGIKTAIQEVETFGESLGMDSAHKEELKSFDPINELGSAGWQNCAEKVKCLLRDPNQDLSQHHLRFKEELHLKISSVLSEQSLFQESSVDETNQKWKSDFISSTRLQESNKELDILNPFPDIWVGIIHQLKYRIHEQMANMCQMIQSSTFTLEKSEQKQILKIYENILLSEIMDDMCKLFEMALKTYCKELYSRVSSLSYSDLMADMVFSDDGKTDSGKNDISNSDLPHKKESIVLASEIPLRSKSKSMSGISKEMSKISISSPQESKRFKDWKASYRPSLTDSVRPAFSRRSVSMLYREADIEYRVLCKEDAFCKGKTRPVAMHEAEFSSDALPPKEKDEKMKSISLENVEKFLNYFRPSLLSIEKFFSSNTFQEKLNCMIRTLKCISYSIMDTENRLVTADDIIGILSVLFHSLSEEQLKRLCTELVLINTFLPKDEQMSLIGNALVHFMCSLEALYMVKGNKTNTF